MPHTEDMDKVADPKEGGVGFGSQIDKRLKCASRFAVLVTTRLRAHNRIDNDQLGAADKPRTDATAPCE